MHGDGLACEQQRAVQRLLARRLHTEGVGFDGARLGAGPVSLVQRDHGRDDGEHQKRHDASENEPQTTPGALAARSARVEELLLGGVELGLVLRAPFHRRRQPPATVQVAAIASTLAPLARRPAQPAMQPPAVGVLVEPAA